MWVANNGKSPCVFCRRSRGSRVVGTAILENMRLSVEMMAVVHCVHSIDIPRSDYDRGFLCHRFQPRRHRARAGCRLLTVLLLIWRLSTITDHACGIPNREICWAAVSLKTPNSCHDTPHIPDNKRRYNPKKTVYGHPLSTQRKAASNPRHRTEHIPRGQTPNVSTKLIRSHNVLLTHKPPSRNQPPRTRL